MNRDIPVFNRLVMDKIYRQNQQRHIQRLRKIKNSTNVQNKTSYSQSHGLNNRKAQLKQETNKTQIEKQNVLLFNKMIRIMKRNDPHNQPQQALNQSISYKPRSSTNFSRISQENRNLLGRIQQQKPTISNKKLMHDRMKNLSVLKFMGKYPNLGASRDYAKLEEITKLTDNSTNEQCDLAEAMDEKEVQYYKNQFRRFQQRQLVKLEQKSFDRRRIQSQNQNRVRAQQEEQEPERINRNRTSEMGRHRHSITLFCGQEQISGQKMEIRIMRHYNSYQIRATALPKSEKEQSYSLQIPQDEGNQFFVCYDYNYQKIASMLVVEDGKLVLQVIDGENETQQDAQTLQNEPIKTTNDRMFQTEEEPLRINMGFANYEEALDQFIQ